MNKSKRKLRGFTLLELVTVLAIIAVMAAVLVPNVADYMVSNRIRSANSQAQQIFMAAQDYLVSEQIKGTTTKDITGTDTPGKLCWIAVTTEGGSRADDYDRSNKTTVDGFYGIKASTATDNTGFDTRKVDGKDSYPMADGIESRLESGFTGSWLVAFYPSTFTVAYAVYNGFYKTAAETKDAVLFIGSNGGIKNDTCCIRLYSYEFKIKDCLATQCQELDFKHPAKVTEHLYTGQYPVRDFSKDPI